nr:hypothetical protein Q903MT_gene3648 [Picea sitchensis]
MVGLFSPKRTTCNFLTNWGSERKGGMRLVGSRRITGTFMRFRKRIPHGRPKLVGQFLPPVF